MMKWLLIFPCCFLLAFQDGFSDVSSDLNNYFDNLGYASNVTGPGAYQDQSAGYYSGGSLFLRAPSRDLQIANIQIPSLKAGCGGISMFFGGASFVNSSELISFGKEVMSNAGPYAFHLALETYAPQIEGITSKLQYWAQQINQNNLTSCEASEDLVGGMWGKHTSSQREICQDLGMQNNVFSDWAAARQGCGYDGQGDSTLNSLQKTPQGKAIITRNINIVWQSILQNQFLQSDTELAEFFMSLSGTIVFDQLGNPTIFPSMIQNQDMLNSLLNGGQASIYSCATSTDNSCLSISTQTITVDPSDALVFQVNQLLLDIESRYQQDIPLTPTEEGFINSTSLPVLKFIQVSLESGNSLNTQNYAELVAEDILEHYLSGIITLIQGSLANSQFTGSKQQILNNLAIAQKQVEEINSNVYRKIQAQTALINQSMQFQKMVMGSLSSQLKDNLNT